MWLKVRPEAEEVRVEVIDTGPGIPLGERGCIWVEHGPEERGSRFVFVLPRARVDSGPGLSGWTHRGAAIVPLFSYAQERAAYLV